MAGLLQKITTLTTFSLIFLTIWIAAVTSALSKTESVSASQIQQARSKGQINLADTLAADLMAKAQISGDTQILATALYESARNSMERNKYDEAQVLLNESIEAFQTINDSSGLGQAFR